MLKSFHGTFNAANVALKCRICEMIPPLRTTEDYTRAKFASEVALVPDRPPNMLFKQAYRVIKTFSVTKQYGVIIIKRFAF